MIRYSLLLALIAAQTGCAGSFWCFSYSNGYSGSDCYAEEDTCHWHRDRQQVSAADLDVSECTAQSYAYCYSAKRQGREFEECYPDKSECESARKGRAKANEGTHSFSECTYRSAS